MRCSVLAICDIATHDAGGWRMNGLSKTRWIKAFRFMSNQPRQAPREALVIQYKTIQEMAATGTSIHRSTDLMNTTRSWTIAFSSVTAASHPVRPMIAARSDAREHIRSPDTSDQSR